MRFFPNKDKARDDWRNQSIEDMNAGDKLLDGIAFIAGHCAGQRFGHQESFSILKDFEKLAKLAKVIRTEDEADMVSEEAQAMLFKYKELFAEANNPKRS